MKTAFTNDRWSSAGWRNCNLHRYRQPIGEQTWTDRNLDVATYRDGTAIPEEQDPDKWENLKTGAWCYYENNQKSATYGKLYNWYAVMGITTEEDATPTQEQIGARKELAPAGTFLVMRNGRH
jgi:uncharacterized protein (TIGR02145 family)